MPYDSDSESGFVAQNAIRILSFCRRARNIVGFSLRRLLDSLLDRRESRLSRLGLVSIGHLLRSRRARLDRRIFLLSFFGRGRAVDAGLGFDDRLVLGSFAGFTVHLDGFLDLATHALQGIHSGLLCGVHVGGLGNAGLLAVQVRTDEETDEKIGQGQQVGNVEGNGESLTGGVHAGDHAVVHAVNRSKTHGLLLSSVQPNFLQPRRCGGNARRGLREGQRVVDEQVRGGHGGSKEKLGDLHRGQGALDQTGDADTEGCEGVVGVLQPLVFMFWCDG